MWPRDPGTYALIFTLPRPLSLTVGRLGTRLLLPGEYVYVGSARGAGGLAARLHRHLKRDKRLHWHVDYLATQVFPRAVLYTTAITVHECDWVTRLLHFPGTTIPWVGFGNSDCVRCPSHLVCVQNTDPNTLQAWLGAEGLEYVDKMPSSPDY